MNRLKHYFDRMARGDDTPGQPKPIMTRICRMFVKGVWVSTIDRKWLYGETSRCRLCPRCTAVGSECMLMINARVGDQEAPLYRIDREPGRTA